MTEPSAMQGLPRCGFWPDMIIAWFHRVDEWVQGAPVSLLMLIATLLGCGFGALIGFGALVMVAGR